MAKGLSLGTKLFLTTALLILASVGTAVVVTSRYGTTVADQAVREALTASSTAQTQAQQQRYEQLRLVGQLFQTDAALQSYVAETAEAADARSVLDLLGERQASLGYDFAILLDSRGHVVGRTDKPSSTGEDLANEPLVKKAIEDGEANGVWQEGDRLYFAVAVPVVKAFVLQGYLVTGFRLDDTLALDLKRGTGADVAYIARTGTGPQVVASTLNSAEASALVESLRRQGDLMAKTLDRGQVTERASLSLGGRAVVGLISPLRDAAGQPVGASVSLASSDRAAAGYRRIQQVLAVVGGLSILIAGALSYLLSRRAMRPVQRLVAATEAARQGNYDQKIGIGGSDEVGRLARSFDVLLADLREKRDMEAYVADLSRNLPDAGGSGAPTRAPQSRRVALLGLDLRTYAQRRMLADAPGTLDMLARDIRRISTAVSSRRGRIDSVLGHRVLASFEGDRPVFAAMAAAAEIHQRLSMKENAFDETESPAAAIAVGDAVTGSLMWGQGSGTAVAGPAVQQLEGLLREAAVGDVLLSKEAHEELREPVFERAGYESRAQRALVGGLQFHALSGDTTVQLVASAGEVIPEAEEASAGGQATLAGVAPGTLLGHRFEILSVLGAGGMGVVYKARDRELDDLVALKMLKRHVADDPDTLARLKSELKLARKITHPNVLRTFDFGEIDGMHYISMEYVRGITLRYLLDQEGRLPYSAGLRIAKQLLAGLGAAHEAGVLHRDIKPENLILDHAGSAKLMDFGIARPTKQRADIGQTQAGWVVGTPQYLAPEQIEGRDLDERADIYATGVVLFEIFTGSAPFRDENAMQVMLKHLHEAPPPPRNLWPDIPKDLDALILKALEKDREKRFRRVPDLLKALNALA
jgi:serine/threonine-protein kinase